MNKISINEEQIKLKNKNVIIINEPTSLQIIYYEIFLNKKIMDIIALFINIYSLYLYYKSLEGCIGTQIECLKVMTLSKFYKMFYQVMRCGFYINLVLLLAYFKKISLISIIYPLITYLFFYLIDNGSDLAHHGRYNFLAFCIFLFSFFILSLFLIYMIILYKKGRKNLFFFIFFSILILFVIIFINLYSKTFCGKWNKGLNNVELDNDETKYPCKFVNPKRCYINAFNGLFDISKYIGKTCKKIGKPFEQRKKLFKFIDENSFKNTTRLGFPITTTKDFWLRTQKNIEHFSERVLSRMIDMDKITENISKPEVYIDFSDKNYPYGKININLIKNNTLIQERNHISKNLNTTFDNILFIYLDSISRQHFKRKMKYLSSFLEKYMDDNNKNTDEIPNIKSFQFLKYHTFAAFTQKNVQPMFYGEKMDPTTSNGTSLIKYIKKQGYITGQSSNLCSKELFVTMNNCLNNVEFSDFDHENVAMFCDPNYYDRTNPYPIFSGPFSIIRRCLYQKDTYEYVLEYGKQFWENYKDNKKFLRLSFIDAHEGTGEVVKYLDKPIYDFLINLLDNNMLRNTAIIFASDHGNGMPGFYNIINSEDFLYENVLGFLAFVLFDFKDEKGIQYLEKNQQILVSPYDIHDTLIDIIYNGKNKEEMSRNGESLFRGINPMERSCLKYSEISEDLCRCIKNNN